MRFFILFVKRCTKQMIGRFTLRCTLKGKRKTHTIHPIAIGIVWTIEDGSTDQQHVPDSLIQVTFKAIQITPGFSCFSTTRDVHYTLKTFWTRFCYSFGSCLLKWISPRRCQTIDLLNQNTIIQTFHFSFSNDTPPSVYNKKTRNPRRPNRYSLDDRRRRCQT